MKSTSYDKVVFAILTLGCSVGVLLKSDVYLPVITRLVNPLLAEREKTFQLESAIRWWEESAYDQYRLVLCKSAASPKLSTNVANRRDKAPTSQIYLDRYTSSLASPHAENPAGELLICFGDDTIAGAESLYTIPGKYAGQAAVYAQHE